MAAAAYLGLPGSVRTTTLRAFSAEEFGAILSRVAS